MTSPPNRIGPTLARIGLLAAGLLLVGGCARYNYDVLEAPPLHDPPGIPAPTRRDAEPAPDQEVTSDREVTVERLPLRYRMQVVENRLVIRVFNSSEQVVEIVGGRSSVADPTGRSHPLRNRVLTPGAFAKLVLPPLRSAPAPRDGLSVHGRGGYGPGLDRGEFGLGASTTFGVGGDRGFTPADGHDVHWTWPGEGQVRLTLVYRSPSDGREWTHTFRFARRRAD